MFFKLGMLNVRRQLTRSMSVILTLALAAISLTYSLAMQDIPPLRVAPFLSRFTGGNILVIPFRWAGQTTSDATGSELFRSTQLTPSGSSWLEWFYPELYDQGFWIPQGGIPTEFFEPALLEELASFPGIDRISTLPMLQVVIRSYNQLGMVDFPIRVAPLTKEIIDLAEVSAPNIKVGVFLNYFASVLNDKMRYSHMRDAETPVDFLLPRMMENGKLDYSEAIDYTLPFGNYIAVPTRTVYWSDTMLGTRSEVGHFSGDIVWIGEESWQELLTSIGAEAAALPLNNLALQVDDLQLLDETVTALNAIYPQLTFVKMGEVEERIFQTGSIERFGMAPPERVGWVERQRLAIPTSFNHIFAYLLVLIAAILLGGHMLTGAAARNQEIGTLRALGARRKDILAVGIGETITLTLIGVMLGFFPIRLFGIIMQLRGGQHFLQVMWGTSGEFLQILGLALVAALAFALAPILRLTRVAPMEVLRNE